MQKGIVAAIMVPHPPLIIPEVGKGGENVITETTKAYQEAAKFLASFQPEVIIMISPHQTLYMDYFHISPGAGAKGSFASFGAPQVKFEVEYDQEFYSFLSEEIKNAGLQAGPLGEKNKDLDHGTMVPLYFINQYWTDYKLIRIGLSGQAMVTHYELGMCIRKAAQRSGKRVAVVGSGDLSHRLKEDGPYGFMKEGPEYDERIMDVMGRAAFGELFDFTEEFCELAGECGHRSFIIMAGALDRTEVKVKKLSHQGVTGVGYGICTFEPVGEDAERNFGEKQKVKEEREMRKHREKEGPYVRYARNVIEHYIREDEVIAIPDDLPEELYHTKAGAFVSIKKDGKLRGCIGTILETKDSLAEEIRDNAISASTMDPRFPAIGPEELNRLTISVDILGKPEKIKSPEELDVKRYGVIVTKGMKRGLLLPNLDGIDTVEEQIRIAKQKAGLKDWDEVQLERFEVVRHF